jgi:hypothetical protein
VPERPAARPLERFTDADLRSAMSATGTCSASTPSLVLNSLNVYPVPDADTGTNMTVQAVVAALGQTSDMASTCRAISREALQGAGGSPGLSSPNFFQPPATGSPRRHHPRVVSPRPNRSEQRRRPGRGSSGRGHDPHRRLHGRPWRPPPPPRQSAWPRCWRPPGPPRTTPWGTPELLAALQRRGAGGRRRRLHPAAGCPAACGRRSPAAGAAASFAARLLSSGPGRVGCRRGAAVRGRAVAGVLPGAHRRPAGGLEPHGELGGDGRRNGTWRCHVHTDRHWWGGPNGVA